MGEITHLEAELDQWESFYNFQISHGAHSEKTPYVAVGEKLYSTEWLP